MTQLEFIAECAARFIDPAIAIECPEIQDALRSRDKQQILQALDENF